MKKFSKILMAMLVICFAFVFTACNKGELDTEVKVDKGNEADYVTCTAENSLLAKFGQEGEEPAIQMPEEMTGVKFTIKGSMGMDGVTVDVNLNVMLTVNPEANPEEMGVEDIGLAVKGSVEGETPQDGNMSYNIKAYLKEGVMYVNMDAEMGSEKQSAKFKMDLTEMMNPGESEPEAPMDFDIEAILGNFLTDCTEKVIEDGDDATYQLSNEDVKVYVVIEDGKFDQALIEMEEFDLAGILGELIPGAEGAEIPAITGLSLAFEVVDGGIDYPSFDGYQTYEEYLESMETPAL